MTSDARRMPSPDPSEVFSCRQCGECCRGFGGTLVTERDILAIADYIDASPGEFVRKYCAESGAGLVLAQGKDGYCIFAEGALCGIHPVKPRMCRAWPFIEGVLRAPENWRVMAGACPGIRGDAPAETVRRCVETALSAAGDGRRGT